MSRAYLIDPHTQTVSEAVHHPGDAYRHVEADGIDAAHVGSVTKNDGRLVRVTIYVNDEGYFERDQTWFRFGAYPNPLGGKGLLVGVDHEGVDIDPPFSIEIARKMVSWLGAQTPKLPDVVHYAIDATMGETHEVGRWDQNEERERRLRERCNG